MLSVNVALTSRTQASVSYSSADAELYAMIVAGLSATWSGQANVDWETGVEKKGVKSMQSRIFKNTSYFVKGRKKGGLGCVCGESD